MKSKDFINEEWSDKYKRSINCASPKGFSQRAHCAGRKKNESVTEGLQIGDPVIITGNVQFKGKTGDVVDIGRDGAFVVVDLYNHGRKSFHSSDVSYNDYAGSDNEQEYQQGVAEGSEQISIKVRNGRNKFATELSVDGNPAGVYQYDANSGRSIAEVYPEYKGKGFGKILVLHAIYTAAKLGMDFVEDESRTAEYDNVLDSLDSNGLAVNDDGYWYVTGEGEQYLKQCLKQGVAEGSETHKYKVVVKGHKRSYQVWVEAKNEEVAIIRAQQYVAREHNDTAKRAAVVDMKKGVAEADLAEPPERPRKQDTKTKTKPDIKFDIPFQQDQDRPLAKTDPLDDLKKKAGIGGDKPKVTIKKASQADTLSKTAGIGSDDMADMLSRMRNIEIDRDLEAYPEPEPPETLPSVEVNTANLPAVAGQALQAAGVQNPEFHQVANLPGNMSDQIRQLGKSLFGSLTMTPTKRIHVVANLGGQGPNTTQEVNAVAGFLKEHGKDLGPGDVDFNNVMPGYKADTHMFSAAGIRWMLVKDFAGQYIYCWPEEDSHDAVDAIGMDKNVKRLR